MASNLNFRSALSGFNREDVVHYIEYMNNKFNTQLNQLTGEAQELRDKLTALAELPDLTGELAALQQQLEESAARQASLEEENARLLAELEEMKAQQADRAALELAAMELEAYRRAEQTERAAKARAEQIYQQATGTLAQATTQVDNAAMQFRQIAEAVSGQMAQLQMAVDSSKNALLDAATTMYAIRPEE